MEWLLSLNWSLLINTLNFGRRILFNTSCLDINQFCVWYLHQYYFGPDNFLLCGFPVHYRMVNGIPGFYPLEPRPKTKKGNPDIAKWPLVKNWPLSLRFVRIGVKRLHICYVKNLKAKLCQFRNMVSPWLVWLVCLPSSTREHNCQCQAKLNLN